MRLVFIVFLTIALWILPVLPVNASSLLGGFVKIRDWDKTNEAFSFSAGQVTVGGGDFFIAPRGIHVFDSPGIIDMGVIDLYEIGEAPASGYVEMATPLDGHSYVVRSNGKYGKFYIDETYDWLDPVEYGIEWVYQINGTRTFEGAGTSVVPATPGPTVTGAEYECPQDVKEAYQQYMAAYNKLLYLNSKGEGDTPAAQIAYEQYAKAKACYESRLSGSEPTTTTPATTGSSHWIGTWQTNWGEMILSQTGNQVSGTYSHDSGRITGTVSGNTLIGTWAEAPSYSPPNDAGDVQLTITSDYNSLTGEWRYGSSGSWSGDWKGTRTGASSTPTATQTPTGGAGLVLHLPFDGSYNDASGYGNHGTPKGSMRFTNGVVGQQCASFDGQSYVEIPDSNSLDLSRAFTFSVWLNREVTTGGWWYVLSKGDTSETGDYAPYSLWHSHSGIGTQIPSVTLADHGQPRYVHSSTPTDARVWYHLAVTWDGNNVKFYKDGVGDTKPWQGAQLLPNSPSKLVIGCVPPVPQGAMYERYFKGMMDDLRIYNYALSDSEVQGLYSGAGHATPTPTPTPTTTPAATGQQQLYPVADGDAYAYSYRNWNWANWGQNETMAAGWSPAGGERRSYLRFDLPAGQGFSRAVLKLYQYHSAGSVHSLGVYRVTSPWDEGTDTYHSGNVEETAAPGELCWMQQPSFDPVPVATFSSATAVPAWVEVDITSLVQKWQGGTANYGLVVKITNNNPTTSYPEGMSGYLTKEHSDLAHRPVLVLSAKGTTSSATTSTPATTTTTTSTSTPTTTGSAVLVAESRTVDPGSIVQVPIYFRNASNIGSLGFRLSYDPAVVQANKVLKGSLLSSTTFTSNIQSDVIVLGFAAPKDISGTGSAAVIEFKVLGKKGSKSSLKLSDILATNSSGSSVAVSYQDGVITIGQKIKGDADGDGKISVLDALIALKMYVQLIPLDLSLDINKDGRVTPEDARLIMEMAKPK